MKDSPNATAVAVIQGQLLRSEHSFIYLWGGQGTGVSHLLQASCHNALTQKLSAQYISLSEFLNYSPKELFRNLDSVSLICLDDIQAITGKPHWEQEIFSFYNLIRDSQKYLLIGANCPARELPLKLLDLRSRFTSGSIFQLSNMDDMHKSKILQFRAFKRGMNISDDLAQYIITRAPREMGSLMSCLDILEKSTMQEKRRLSKPFVREILFKE
jgi:DnaA family protein